MNRSRAKLIGTSRAISRVIETCLQVAPTDATVLLLGETGTGKELLARAVHEHSGRAGPFVAVNCGAITESLIESELFGHEKGAFTSATSAKPGLFRRANHGTILLDEIGHLPEHAQHSLLRVLQEGCVRPVGGSHELPIDVRVIAATSAPLVEAVRQGTFREDLFYRLDVIRVVVPPLRNRQEDIRPLFEHFCARHAEHHGLPLPQITPEFERALLSYAWPGNVRQLENLAQRLVLTGAGLPLTAEDFRRHTGERVSSPSPLPPASPPPLPPAADDCRVDLSQPLSEFLEAWEARYLQAALERTHGHVQEAAELAGLSRRTLSRRIRRFGLATRVSGPHDTSRVLWLSCPPLAPFPLRPGAEPITLGRHATCDVVLAMAGVSRVHAELREERGVWGLEDAGSRGGTLLNGQPVEGFAPLAPGDVIGVGPFQLRVSCSTSPPATHESTSTHLISVKLDQLPLPVILERFRASRHSARLSLRSGEDGGTLEIVAGEVTWACHTRQDEVVEGEAALPALLALTGGLCVVSASEHPREVTDLLHAASGHPPGHGRAAPAPTAPR